MFKLGNELNFGGAAQYKMSRTPAQVQEAVVAYEALKEAELTAINLGLIRAPLEEVNRDDTFVISYISSLQEQAKEEPLSEIEQVFLSNLLDVAQRGYAGPTYIYVEKLLMDKLGVDAYKKVQRGLRGHDLELEKLQAINNELNKLSELIGRKTTNKEPGPLKPIFDATLMTGRTEEGTYVVEVDKHGLVTEAHKMSAKSISDGQAVVTKPVPKPLAKPTKRAAPALPTGESEALLIPTPTIEEIADVYRDHALKSIQVAELGLTRNFADADIKPSDFYTKEDEINALKADALKEALDAAPHLLEDSRYEDLTEDMEPLIERTVQDLYPQETIVRKFFKKLFGVK